MKKTLITTVCTVLLTGAMALPAFADSMYGKKGHWMEGGEKGKPGWSFARDMYPECRVEMDKLGLSPEAAASLEEKHFKLHTAGIRSGAEIKVLKLQLVRLLSKRDFDVGAATKAMDEIASKKREMGVSHLEFLHDLAAKVGDKDWENLREMMMKMHMAKGDSKEGEMHGMPDMHGMMKSMRDRDDRDDKDEFGGMNPMGHHRDCECKECRECKECKAKRGDKERAEYKHKCDPGVPAPALKDGSMDMKMNAK